MMNEQLAENDFQIIVWDLSIYQFSPDLICKYSLEDEEQFPRSIYSLKDIKTYYWDEQIIEFFPEVNRIDYGKYISIVIKGDIIFTAYSLIPEISIFPKIPIPPNPQKGGYYSEKYWPYLILTPYNDFDYVKTFKDYPKESKAVLQNLELYEYLKSAKKIKKGHVDLKKLFNTEEIYYGPFIGRHRWI